MGILRRLREWRERADGTLEGPAISTGDLSHNFSSGEKDKLSPIEYVPNPAGAYGVTNLPEHDRYIFDMEFWNNSGSGKIEVTLNGITTADYIQFNIDGSLSKGNDAWGISMENESTPSAYWSGRLVVNNPIGVDRTPTVSFEGAQGFLSNGLSHGTLRQDVEVSSVEFGLAGSSSGLTDLAIYGYDRPE